MTTTTDTQHFNITHSSKLADYLRKFDVVEDNHNKSKRKITQQNQTDYDNDDKLNLKKKKIVIEEEKSKFNRSSLETQKLNKRPSSSKQEEEEVQRKRKEEGSRSDKLRNECIEKLMHSQFRNINQYLYENPTVQAIRYMTPDLFKKYHESYSQLVEKWPIKPLDVIINEIERLTAFNKRLLTIADLGCGEARLAKYFKDTNSNTIVHSIDLVDYNEFITKASIDNVPLNDNSCDIVVYCLSLMPINIKDCIIEANRILKKNGLIYIAEVVSRFEENKFKVFQSSMQQFGFQLKKQTILEPDNYFVLFRFKKISSIDKLKGLPSIKLKPCKYKTR